MALICTTDPITSNYAEFEDDEVSGNDQGAISWDNPYEVSGGWKLDFEGTDVEGSTISSTTIDIAEEYTINPTKVAKWLIKKAKEFICPNCGLP